MFCIVLYCCVLFCRLKLLSKQVDDGHDLRKQLSETVNDLQRQLTNEREENKKSKKRYIKQQNCCYFHLSFFVRSWVFCFRLFPIFGIFFNFFTHAEANSFVENLNLLLIRLQSAISIFYSLFVIRYYNLSEYNYWK